MAAGTSPSITTVGDGQPAVAYQDNGFLVTGLGTADDIEQAGAGDAGTSFGLPVASGTTPSIVAAIPPPGGLSLTANGNILARLRKPRTLVLLVYSDQHGHQRLLGRVALGNHPAGLSRIKWGLRVDGHRLGAGGYLAELEGRLSGTALTTGGPTAGFQITHAGRLKIGRLSCSARTSTC